MQNTVRRWDQHWTCRRVYLVFVTDIRWSHVDCDCCSDAFLNRMFECWQVASFGNDDDQRLVSSRLVSTCKCTYNKVECSSTKILDNIEQCAAIVLSTNICNDKSSSLMPTRRTVQRQLARWCLCCRRTCRPTCVRQVKSFCSFVHSCGLVILNGFTMLNTIRTKNRERRNEKKR
jgi:hypothetical protein